MSGKTELFADKKIRTGQKKLIDLEHEAVKVCTKTDDLFKTARGSLAKLLNTFELKVYAEFAQSLSSLSVSIETPAYFVDTLQQSSN